MKTAELKRLAEAATPGPWIAGDDEDSDYLLIGPHDGDHIVYQPVVSLHNEANAAFIAAANPAAILKLLEINAELVEALGVMTELCAIKYGNLDKDAYEWIQKSRELRMHAKAE